MPFKKQMKYFIDVKIQGSNIIEKNFCRLHAGTIFIHSYK